jgi:hypothetical protein
MSLAETVPVFINCRDRVSALHPLIDFLERAGCKRIVLLDNGSTYAPLLDLYERTPHEVVRLGDNVGHKSLWVDELVERLGVSGPFVFTDPDIVPIEECPLDAIDYFAEVLDRYPGYSKAGFGLKIDDLPDHFEHKSNVLAWESRFWRCRLAPRLYEAPIDTTFALYRAPREHSPRSAIRTGYPYLARHTTWYLDSDDLPEEERYYRAHARTEILTWGREQITERLSELIAEIENVPGPPGVEGGEVATAATAWQREPRPVDESEYTPWAKRGWHAWNGASPEVEFCEFAALLVRLHEPAHVIETGTGQGFLARRVRECLGPDQRLVCYEADGQRREALASLPCFDGRLVRLSQRQSPIDAEFRKADLAVLDSGAPHRFDEIRGWWRAAPPGSLVLVHDTGNGHAPDSLQAELAALVRELEIPGIFLKNPRGAFLGLKL